MSEISDAWILLLNVLSDDTNEMFSNIFVALPAFSMKLCFWIRLVSYSLLSKKLFYISLPIGFKFIYIKNKWYIILQLPRNLIQPLCFKVSFNIISFCSCYSTVFDILNCVIRSFFFIISKNVITNFHFRLSSSVHALKKFREMGHMWEVCLDVKVVSLLQQFGLNM